VPRRETGVCSECGEALANPQAKTCGAACRQKRARRIKRSQTGRPPLPEHLAVMSAEKGDKLVHEVAKEELRPIVREAITEDVLRAAGRLVALTPMMVDAIEEDLQSSDKILRQKAYSLLARFTLGNQSIAPQADAPAQQPMQVVFNMPRPGSTDAPVPLPAEHEDDAAPAEEVQECMECHDYKPLADFFGGSNRCIACHEELQAKVRERFGA
jgi:hypothetical protein